MDPRRKALSKTLKKRSFKNPQGFLGVDLIEMARARSFYRTHKNRLSSYFDKSEIKIIRQSAAPYRSLAMLLAAKEAVFKAGQIDWMGTEGFRKIRILSNGNNRLFFRLRGNYKRAFAQRPYPTLSFVTSKDYVVAECR